MKMLCFLLMLLPLAMNGQYYLGLGADFGGLNPSGNWANNHGSSFTAGSKIEYGNEAGLILALQGHVIFGNNVQIDPIAGLRSDAGVLLGDINDEARFADIGTRTRGYRGSLLVGYQRAFGNAPLGFRALAGPSYMMHLIRIQNDANQTTNNLRDEYKSGYNRKAAGWGAYGEIGPQYIHPENLYRFYILLTGSRTDTAPLNSTQFDTMTVLPEEGTDLSIGVRVGFVLGLFRDISRERAEDIYY